MCVCAPHRIPTPPHPSCFHEWQAGISLFAVGNVLNFVSFGFAAQSLLAALGSVQFVSNVVFARFVLGERVTWRVLGATALIVGGCILLVSFGSHASDLLKASQLVRLYGNPAYITYLVFMFVGVGASYWLYRAGKKAVANPATPPRARSRWHRSLPISYAAFSGLLGTQSVLFCKALSTLLRTTLHGKSQLGSWFFWVSLLALALTAVFWVSRLNKGLRLFPATVIVPTMQISWTLFSIVSGMIYYREYRSFTTLSALMFAGGVGLVFVGVWLLTPAGRDADADTAAAAGGVASPPIDPLDAAAAAATPAAIVVIDRVAADGKPPSRGASPVPSRRTVSPDGRPPSVDGASAAPASPGAASAAVLGSSPTPSAPWSDVPLGTSPDGRAGIPPPALTAGATSPPRAASSDRARLRHRSCNSFVADIVHDFSMDARSSVRPLLGLGPPGDMAAVSLFSVPYESRLPTGGGGVFAASPAASAVLASPEASDVEGGGGGGDSGPAVVVCPVGRWSALGDVERGAASSDGATRPLPQQRPPDMDALAAAAAAAAARSRLPSRAPRTTGGRSPGAPPRRSPSGGDVELLPPAAAAWAADAVRTAPPPPRPPPKE